MTPVSDKNYGIVAIAELEEPNEGPVASCLLNTLFHPCSPGSPGKVEVSSQTRSFVVSSVAVHQSEEGFLGALK